MSSTRRKSPAKKQATQRRAPPKPQRKAGGSNGRSTAAELPLDLRARGVEVSAPLLGYMRKRVGFKLGKFALQLSKVTVRLESASGPKGEPLLVAKLKVQMPLEGSVVVESRNADLRGAFDAAADATERAVRRLIEKRQAGRTRG